MKTIWEPHDIVAGRWATRPNFDLVILQLPEKRGEDVEYGVYNVFNGGRYTEGARDKIAQALSDGGFVEGEHRKKQLRAFLDAEGVKIG